MTRRFRELKVQIVAGAANNQLLEERHGTMLRDRSILYAPDYVANAGGVLNGCIEVLGWTPELAHSKVIGDLRYDFADIQKRGRARHHNKRGRRSACGRSIETGARVNEG